MKRIGLALDYDGCTSNRKYIYPFTPEKIKDIKTNTSIIETNTELWNFILELCQENPDLEILDILYFSARTDVVMDTMNSRTNQCESYFLAMEKMISHTTKLLKVHAPNVMVKSNRMLVTDIHHNREFGHTVQKALEDIDYSAEGKGIIKAKRKHDDDLQNDESKVSFVFAHAHSEELDALYILDDVLLIHECIVRFYGNQMGAGFIPRDMKVVNCHYDDGSLIRPFLSEIIGTGDRCPRYREILQAAVKKSDTGFRVFPQKWEHEYTMSFVEKFNTIYQEYHYEDLFKLTELQTSLADAKPITTYKSKREIEAEQASLMSLTPSQQSLLTGFCGFFSHADTTNLNNCNEVENKIRYG